MYLTQHVPYDTSSYSVERVIMLNVLYQLNQMIDEFVQNREFLTSKMFNKINDVAVCFFMGKKSHFVLIDH